MSSTADNHNRLVLRGVSENNLRELDVALTHDIFTVIAGVSGSGKTTLAFDTIYAEGGRRYIETFSPYTRQYLDRLQRPHVEALLNVRPALALEQRNKITSSRSTVGTVTEINDYLKIVWSQLSTLYCPSCRIPVTRTTVPSAADDLQAWLSDLPDGVAVVLAFPLSLSGAASAEALRATLRSEGFLRYLQPQSRTLSSIEDLADSDLEGQELWVVVERLRGGSTAIRRERLLSSVGQAFTFGHGSLIAVVIEKTAQAHGPVLRLAQGLRCAGCDQRFNPPKPSLFTFNSPLGACGTCQGFGRVLTIDRQLCIPDPRKSLKEGAIACWPLDSRKKEYRKLQEFCAAEGIDFEAPWKSLSAAQQNLVFSGRNGVRGFRGLLGWFDKLQQKRHKMHVRVLLSRFRSETLCPTCMGDRLQPEASLFVLADRSLPEIWRTPIEKLVSFFEGTREAAAGNKAVENALEEVISRIRYLNDIGLQYLTLDRQSRTLSGGESQRVNLTSILGSRLVHTILVLDEPTIGLHPRDTDRLLRALRDLRNRGNSVVVVEHDPEIIRAADEVLELGPGAGSAGGTIVFQGSPEELERTPRSATGRYLNEKTVAAPPVAPRRALDGSPAIVIAGARAHNLKNLTLRIPVGGLIALTGVSGSGKSTLVTKCLHEPYRKIKNGVTLANIRKGPEAPLHSLRGLACVDDIVLVDQSPIGRSPRSNPATYTKAWDSIRECLAETESAVRLGLGKSAFSFNVEGGRCPVCKGAGQLRIEMQFLADVYVQCEACAGSRFQDTVLTARFGGKNVVDILNLTLSEAVELFSLSADPVRAARISSALQPLIDLGLGYLRLGHPLNAVSGGEAQRIKLASYLDTSETGTVLFILDEPTTGLHPLDIQGLLKCFDRLIERGHTILCIEHNLDVIARADWMIDLGPEAGEHGGHLVAEGAPRDLLADAKRTASSHTLRLLKEASRTRSSRKAKRVAAALPAKPPAPAIEIRGAREHNLRDLSLAIPHNKLTAVTGVSGSGKSTLAFDILFAEGQRRYIDCLSPYARQYIKQLARADVDQVVSIPPTIAVSQKTAPPMGVSTIATTTEIYQYLRLLFAKVGEQRCIVDDTPIAARSGGSIAREITARFAGQRIFLFAPAVSGRKGYYHELFNRALRAELNEAKIDGKMVSLHPNLRLERHKLHWISLKVGSLTCPREPDELLRSAVEQCLLLGSGVVEVYADDVYAEPELFSVDRVCPECSRSYRELDPQDFSFRSARGVCERCGGRGKEPSAADEFSFEPCKACSGARIGPVGRHVTLGGKRIHQLAAMTAPALLEFIGTVDFDKRFAPVVEPIVEELVNRLKVICSVGLSYLTLDRDASSISGGEAQRLRLARTMGSPLTGVCYVFDEPSIGLHASDHAQLMSTLMSLRDAGNTVIVVEHDEDTIRSADYVVDIGPGGGAEGGKLVALGTPLEIEEAAESRTGQALRERRTAARAVPDRTAPIDPADYLLLEGASANNLRGLTVRIPRSKLTVVAGVSGAGKSSLVHRTLVPAIVEEFEGARERAKFYPKTWHGVSGLGDLERLIEIDQSPVGKTSSSTPASYIGIFDEIRKVYALLPEAKARGWSASHFSFNTGKGRCETCEGKGFLRVPMSFLPEAVTTCEACAGLRYNDETLEVAYQGISIGELLQKTFAEARALLSNHRKVCRTIDYVLELGLGYLSLGQPTHSLSGGEAQRLKIARELGAREAKNTLYLLDEPTVGLHMTDVDKLHSVLRKLVALGNTVVLIEHNLDSIRAADYLIELGPGPGDNGGRLLFSGSPAELLEGSVDTPTKRYLSPVRDTDGHAAGAVPAGKARTLRAARRHGRRPARKERM